MKFKIVLLVAFLFLIVFASAQNYNNPRLPRITNPSTSVTSSAVTGGNVTSVTSSTNCITVSPTTGNVVITFNTSCGSGVDTDTWWRLNNTGLVNNSGYLDLNYTTINETIRIKINEINTSAIYTTHNQTYFNFLQNLSAYTCASGNVVNGVNSNGTVKCIVDANTGPTISNSSLNAIYLNLSGTNANQNINISFYNLSAGWFKGLFNWTTLNNWLSFDGAVLSFNETKLNNTIDDRALSSSEANGTYMKKAGDNATGLYDFNQANGVLGAWTTFSFLGTQVGRVTSENAVFQILGVPGVFATWLGDCNSACLIAGVDSVFQMSAVKSNQIKTNNALTMELNRTLISHIANDTIFDNPNGTRILQINSTRTNLNSNFTVSGYINVTKDVCITGGKCLSLSIVLSNNPSFNNTMIYWNNDTSTWVSIPESPANSEVPIYCNSGSTPRWTFVDKGTGVCPL